MQPIHVAASDADLQALQRELRSGVSPLLVDPANPTFPPSFYLCKGGGADRVACLHALLEAGADVNARNEDGESALHFAALYGDPTLMAAILRAGADVNSRDAVGLTPLHWLCRKSPSEQSVQLLLRNGAAVNDSVYDPAHHQHNTTPLAWATAGRPSAGRRVLPILLRAGATIPDAGRMPAWETTWDQIGTAEETAGQKVYTTNVYYLQKIAAAGGFRKYELAHINALLATFSPKFSHLLPPEMVRHVVEFWLHAGCY